MNAAEAEKKWYVYLLCDPDTEQPFYIGKGTGDRMYQHERLRRSDSNSRKIQIIKNIHARGREVLKKKIAEFDVEQDAYIYEWGLIHMYHDLVTNSTEGVKGRKAGTKNMPRESLVEPLWTIEKAAAYLHLSPDEVMLLDGLPRFTLGNRLLRFRPEEVRDWVIRNEAIHELVERNKAS